MSKSMGPRPYIIAETNWKTVRDTVYEVAVLPWGATEAHNYHMPYATDNFQLDHISAEAGRLAWEAGAKVGILPCVPFGVNTGQLDIRMTINMNPSTQALVLNDVVDSLNRQGIRRLVVINGHGGNCFKQMARELQAKYPGVFISVISWFKVVDFKAYFDDPGDHADEAETSLMMHLEPDLLLPLSEAGDGSVNVPKLKAMREGWAWAQRDWLKATNDTGSGDPKLATAEKGARLFAAITEKIGSYLVELSALDPDLLYES